MEPSESSLELRSDPADPLYLDDSTLDAAAEDSDAEIETSHEILLHTVRFVVPPDVTRPG